MEFCINGTAFEAGLNNCFIDTIGMIILILWIWVYIFAVCRAKEKFFAKLNSSFGIKFQIGITFVLLFESCLHLIIISFFGEINIFVIDIIDFLCSFFTWPVMGVILFLVYKTQDTCFRDWWLHVIPSLAFLKENMIFFYWNEPRRLDSEANTAEYVFWSFRISSTGLLFIIRVLIIVINRVKNLTAINKEILVLKLTSSNADDSFCNALETTLMKDFGRITFTDISVNDFNENTETPSDKPVIIILNNNSRITEDLQMAKDLNWDSHSKKIFIVLLCKSHLDRHSSNGLPFYVEAVHKDIPKLHKDEIVYMEFDNTTNKLLSSEINKSAIRRMEKILGVTSNPSFV